MVGSYNLGPKTSKDTNIKRRPIKIEIVNVREIKEEYLLNKENIHTYF